MSADDPAPNGARSSAVTVLTTKLNMISLEFHEILTILNIFSLIRRHHSTWFFVISLRYFGYPLSQGMWYHYCIFYHGHMGIYPPLALQWHTLSQAACGITVLYGDGFLKAVFQYKDGLSTYGDTHYEDKMVRLLYCHNVNSYTGEIIFQCQKLNFWSTCLNTDVPYIFCA